MTRRTPLPSALGTAFTVAEAADRGVSRARLFAADLEAPVRGVRIAGGADEVARAAAIVRALPPGAFVMGRSAARLHRLPVDEPPRLHVGVPRGVRAPRRGGIVARSIDVAPHEIVDFRGILPVTSPSRTWLDLAYELRVADLVAVGDRLIGEDELSSVPELRVAIDAHPRARGAAAARAALPLLSPFAESPAESRLRVLLILAGFPLPEVNVTIRDAGRFVARVDLLFREFGVVVEYEGGHHGSDLRQWRRDVTRIGTIQALGYLVERAHAGDLAAPAPLLARIATQLLARGWRGSWHVPA